MKGLGADAGYWQALEQGELKMQRCNGCGQWHWPAVWHCSQCGSWDHHWEAVEPRGHIFSWTRTWHDFGAPAGLTPPYVSVVVELDALPGKRLLGILADPPQQVHIGMPVTGTPRRDHFDGEPLPAWSWHLLTDPAGGH